MALRDIVTYGRMIKFSHTVFAAPFALAAVVLALREYPLGSEWDILWILLALVGARSAAMGFNRIVDASFDAANPRTKNREIPTGRISKTAAGAFVFFSSLLFVVSAAMLGRLCFYLSFPVLALLFSYSFTKRYTVLCHIYLGFVISLAPMGAWIAVTGSFAPKIALLSLALMTYIAGFDIIYACQDYEFDRKAGLFSLPAKIGMRKALAVSSLLHAASTAFLVIIYGVFDMHMVYLASVVLIGILYVVEHSVVRPERPESIQLAFFNINSIISLVLFAGIAADAAFERFL